jgi:hypothetical protein
MNWRSQERFSTSLMTLQTLRVPPGQGLASLNAALTQYV